MSRARILNLNLVDAATVSTDSAEAGTPIGNLQDAQLGKVWRAAANSAYCLVDFGASVSLSFVGAFGLEGTTALTRRVGMSTSDATGAARDAHDSGVSTSGVDTATFGQMLYFADMTGRYLRVDWADSQPPEVGRLVAGLAWDPGRGIDFPAEFFVVDRSRRQVTPSGNLFIDRGPKQRVLDCIFPAVPEAEAWSRFLAMDLANGHSGDILVALDITDTTYLQQKTLWGPIGDAPALTWRNHGLFGRRLRVEERVRG